MTSVNAASLLRALSVLAGKPVFDAAYTLAPLQGGTVGGVMKVTGTAKMGADILPFSLVVKTQDKWDRHGDPNCWRREYDLYQSGLADRFPPDLYLPRCLLLEEETAQTRIWMEFVEGATGSNHLHADELASCAERIGRFQANFHREGPRGLPFLQAFPAIRSSFDLWYTYIMSKTLATTIQGFPDNIRKLLLDYAAHAEEWLQAVDRLPDTLCQGDVHHDNLILRGQDVYLIDWDCAGYGRMGEDAVDVHMEAFVYSSRDTADLPRYRKRILDAYCTGARDRGVEIHLEDELVRAIFALAWGFRIAKIYLHSQNIVERRRCVDILQIMLA